jgi:Mn2+/Fe2+ NRAMP family transporter
MQFYLQSSVVEKGIKIEEYKYEKLDVYLGAIWGDLVSFFIIVCTAITLYQANIHINSAEEAASALKPLAGNYASVLFAFGLLGASILAVTIIPLSTTYAICESFGFERGVNHSLNEAPAFYGIFTFMVFFSAVLTLIPNLSLVHIMLITQQIAGMLSPVILVFMVLLINRKEVMGNFVNNRAQNLVIWITVLFIITLSVLLVVLPFL